ncbi:MAG: hypothetical protein HRT47_04295 [Candidatus Caenarcaniphilales bacterium]|nr:hypothetical protein [Candidatus Caenarcaniphilales bacterium]
MNFNTTLSDHERVNLVKAQAQINKYIHDAYQSMNAIYGLSEYFVNNSEERQEYNFSEFVPSEFSFLQEEYGNQ